MLTEHNYPSIPPHDKWHLEIGDPADGEAAFKLDAKSDATVMSSERLWV